MDDKRKQIIINEIQYWKTSKLLPEKYCDFLLTLYTRGDEKEIKSKKVFILQCLSVLFFILAIIAFYFTNFSNVMQMLIATAFIFLISWTAYTLRRVTLLWAHLAFLFAAIIFLLLTVHIVHDVFSLRNIFIGITTFIHCIIWLFVGWKWRIHFFTIAGTVGMIVVAFFLFS